MASSGGRLAKQIIGMSNIEQLKAVEKVQKKMGFYQPQDFVHLHNDINKNNKNSFFSVNM